MADQARIVFDRFQRDAVNLHHAASGINAGSFRYRSQRAKGGLMRNDAEIFFL
jgi:hypothetical protein